MVDQLIVRGAREHNPKDVNIDLPRDSLIVFTGLSGSGKSSLAFDTIFAEGQRRYVESLSAYARQFLGQMDKPRHLFEPGQIPGTEGCETVLRIHLCAPESLELAVGILCLL